jgi:hypothetical protein
MMRNMSYFFKITEDAEFTEIRLAKYVLAILRDIRDKWNKRDMWDNFFVTKNRLPDRRRPAYNLPESKQKIGCNITSPIGG